MGVCASKVTDDLLVDCTDRTKRGLDGGKAVIINWDDIDRAASTQTGSMITDLVLKSGSAGFSAEWLKDLASANSAFAPNAEDLDGFLHNFLCRIQTATAENANRAKELSQGRFVIVVQTKYKGALNAEAFKVLGWDAGLKLSEMTYNTLENSGSIPYTASTEDGDVEEYPYNVFYETSNAVSQATFDALFAQI